MKKYISPRDLKKLSAYLDGELSAYSSRKMKNRLARDPNLRAALETFRETKNILQRTPKRRAPHNFSLSPKMVAKSPPMPRLVPALNYATALAMILFFFSILPPFGMSEAPAQEMMLASADRVVGEPAVADAPAVSEEYAAEEEAMPIAEVLEVEEETDDAIPTTEALAEESEGARSVESTPVAELVESVEDAAVEEPPPNNEIEMEKSATDNQTVENSPATTLTPNIEGIAEAKATPTPSFTLGQEILLVLIIFFAITGFVLRRRATTKWEKLS